LIRNHLLTVAALYGKEFPAIIDNYDAENDLDSVATSLELKPLKLSEYEPWPGYWVAAIGSAGGQIIESWDAKYGTHYYLDELDFLIEKLSVHPECKRAGFITEADYEPDDETIQKIEYIKEAFGVEVLIFGLSDWLDYVFQKSKVDKDKIAANWVQNIHAYLSLRLREVAPLDEPTEKWLLALQEVMGSR